MSQTSEHEPIDPKVIDITGDPNPKAFNAALAETRKGDKIVYHRGPHAGGCHKASAMAAQDAGLVSLVQGRIDKSGPFKFLYMAQRTGKRLK